MAYYIESYQDLGRHPKTARLAKTLGISKVTAVGHLQFLWWWCLDYAPDGELGQYASDEIADGAMWEGDPDTFLQALQDARFVDVFADGQGLAIHDWNEYGGKLIQRRRADAERKSAARAKASCGMSAGCPPDVRGKSDVEKRRESKRRESITPPTPPQGGVECDSSIEPEEMGSSDKVIGLPSRCLGFKNAYPRTVHPTSDYELLRSWNAVCKNSEDEMAIASGLKKWKRSVQWQDPNHVCSMKNFLVQRKFEVPPEEIPSNGTSVVARQEYKGHEAIMAARLAGQS